MYQFLGSWNLIIEPIYLASKVNRIWVLGMNYDIEENKNLKVVVHFFHPLMNSSRRNATFL